MVHKRLYQTIGQQLKQQITEGYYQVGEKLPPERLLIESFNVSRTVIREAIIMLELEGLVSVRKGSGIQVIANTSKYQQQNYSDSVEQLIHKLVTELKEAGPFEMLQARQLIEPIIAQFAATQVTKNDIDELKELQKLSHKEGKGRDPRFDKEFHLKIADATNNSVLVLLIELMWFGRQNNPLWLKLHEHIAVEQLNSWSDEHEAIMQSLIRKDSIAAKATMWQHLENTKQALYQASSTEDNPYDKYLFQDDPLLNMDIK